MDRVIEISSVFVDLFNSSAGNPNNIGNSEPSIPVQLQEITEDYIQKILTACCSQQALGASVTQSGSSSIGSSGLRVNEFKPNLDWFNCTTPLLFGKHLKGKLVLLDFFTYCCVNCLHILPILHNLQKRFTHQDGLVIIGVHSAKFPNEQLSANVYHAVEKYSIEHCVVNDTDGTMWNDLAICCWPTLVLIGPNGEPMLVVQGEEFHSQLLPTFIETALQILRQASMISSHDIPEIVLGQNTLTQASSSKQLSVVKQQLLYPGKVCAYTKHFKKKKQNAENSNSSNLNSRKHGKVLIAIADSGHHRIIVCTLQGRVKHVIGGGGGIGNTSTTKKGFKDGNFIEALFHSPQGLCFQNSTTLFVCDTDNHAIRMIDLKVRTVKTIAGNGKKGHDKYGGQLWNSQIINTPWDIVYYKRKPPPRYQPRYTPQPYNMSYYSYQYSHQSSQVVKPSPVRCLLIAMAGLHQIWALYLDKTSTSTCSTMKSKWCSKGLCTMIAGTGKEENRNNSYNGQRASFAQPSGLCISKPLARNGTGSNVTEPSLYIADSESSSIRRMYLDAVGKFSVINVAGGSPDPTDLFTYGDIDGGAGINSRLQHPMDVAWNHKRNILYVADTYNNKIKYVTGLSESHKQNRYKANSVNMTSGIASNAGSVNTLPLPVKLNEPNGLHFIENPQDGSSLLLIADTNNHTIWVYNFDTYVIKKLQLEFPKIFISSLSNTAGSAQIRLNRQTGGQIMLRGRVILGCNSIDTEELQSLQEKPHLMWTLQLPDSTWESKEIKSNTTIPTTRGNTADFKYLIRVPKQELDEDKTSDNDNTPNKDNSGGNKRWNEKYYRDLENESDGSENESDEEEDVVILRCQTSICKDGDKCVPYEFDFVVHVRFGDEENTPQAADTNFSYTLPFSSNGVPLKTSGVNSSASNASTNRVGLPNISGPTANLAAKSSSST